MLPRTKNRDFPQSQLGQVLIAALVVASCGSPSLQSPAQESAAPAETLDSGDELEANPLSVADLDDCSDSGERDRLEFPREPGHEVYLSTFLRDVDNWHSLDVAPTQGAAFESEPYFVYLEEVQPSASFSRASGSSFLSPDALRTTDGINGAVFATDRMVQRITGVQLQDDEHLLLATGWSDGYGANYVYYAFGVDAEERVFYADDCSEEMSSLVDELVTRARVDNFDGTRAEMLLSLPPSLAEAYELGASRTDAPYKDLTPEGDGAGDVPVEMRLNLRDTVGDALVCVMPEDDGLCLATNAHGGKDYSHPISFDASRGPINIYMSDSDGRPETALNKRIVTVELVPESTRAIEIVVDAKLDFSVNLES